MNLIEGIDKKFNVAGFPTKFDDMSQDYWVIFSYFVLISMMGFSEWLKSITLFAVLTVVLTIFAAAGLLLYRIRAGWRWPGTSIKRLLFGFLYVAFVALCSYYSYLNGVQDRYVGVYAWYTIASLIALTGALIANRVVMLHKADFLLCCDQEIVKRDIEHT